MKKTPADEIAKLHAALAEVTADRDHLRSAISEAVTLLQRALQKAEVPATMSSAAPSGQQTARQPALKPAAPPLPPITIATGRHKHTYQIAQVLEGLRRNDYQLLDKLRDDIAAVSHEPERERAAIAALTKAGVPSAILTGPLRAAVVDGSNIANMGPHARAQINYLSQVLRSAWREGYFPIITIVDASLRHQIDRADQLMEMVERGEILMAQPGTSADELLIEETSKRHAVLLTNDRMSEWPHAKALEKRHVTLNSGIAQVGDFHRAPGLWFR